MGTWAVAHSALIVGVGGIAFAGGQEAVLWLYALSQGGAGANLAQRGCETLEAAVTRPLPQQVVQQTASWSAPWWERGISVHQLLGENLPPNFPVIDRFVNGLATSIKSLDLTAPTYQNVVALTSRVQGYLVELAEFSGAAWIQSGAIRARELLLAIPPGAATEAQWRALEAMRQVAAQLDVVLTIVEVP